MGDVCKTNHHHSRCQAFLLLRTAPAPQRSTFAHLIVVAISVSLKLWSLTPHSPTHPVYCQCNVYHLLDGNYLLHCNRWAEPLLARIKESKKHVVMPIIDSIDPDSFKYRGGGVKLLGFTWTLGVSLACFASFAEEKYIKIYIFLGMHYCHAWRCDANTWPCHVNPRDS